MLTWSKNSYLPTGKYDSPPPSPISRPATPTSGKAVVANNSYDEDDFGGRHAAGRLAEWDGQTWRVIEHTAFVEVTGRGNFSGTIFATGWDRASAILMVYTAADDTWRKYRLPKASHTFDHMWQTERPKASARWSMNASSWIITACSAISVGVYDNHIWGVRPISTHLWVLADFCTYRGMLVLGSDNASPHHGANHLAGEPQSGLYFGKTDDLWQFGKPAGWGGPWWDTAVTAGDPSDPYLMTGFDAKVLHLTHGADSAVTVTVDVDFLGNGTWHRYDAFTVAGALRAPRVSGRLQRPLGARDSRHGLCGNGLFHLYVIAAWRPPGIRIATFLGASSRLSRFATQLSGR
ncbi:MAG: hypothetical protein R2854_29080 [Caldilineaceae bacterium]